MDEVIYAGHNYGRFRRDDGQLQDYCSVFVHQDFAETEKRDDHFGGQKAVKHTCTSLLGKLSDNEVQVDHSIISSFAVSADSFMAQPI